MPWLQLHTVTQRASAESLEDAMLASGAVSVTLSDDADTPILEPGVGETPLWDRVRVTALYDVDVDQQAVNSQLAASQGISHQQLHWEVLEDQPWERLWMEHFEPIRCGERLWICPSWREPPNPNAINLALDPGLAFGSGTHPTTFLCLQWLDSMDLNGKAVVDYGCGSGILGIAALLLGADRVVAIDNDPQALLATRDNLARNGLSDDRLITCLPQDTPETSADIVVANILAAPLITLAGTIGGLTKVGGQLCLSGIMGAQTGAVSAAYPSFEFSPVTLIEDWARLNATKLV
ncbi:MAG: 50S ribosomal protein L11 methyltransferase [Porticoccaceae bacterium]|nr:50S ribosomal protein L11 methyltransferase [Porticoccaceae bacterium]